MTLIPLIAALVLTGPAGAGVTVVAHRGQSGHGVENTLPAISYGVQSGAAWIEADVRVTASGRSFVIAHDRTLNRTTNCAGRVARRTLRYIARHCRTDRGYRVPSLGTYLARIAGTDLHLLLELKAPLTERQVARVMAEVRRQGMAARTTVQSFAPGIVAAAVRSAPEIPVWIVASTADAARVDLGLDAGATGVNVRYDHISTDTVASLKAQGLAVSSWTPNDPGIWAMLVAAGVDVIVTDRPAQLVQTLTPAPRDFDGPENGRALVE